MLLPLLWYPWLFCVGLLLGSGLQHRSHALCGCGECPPAGLGAPWDQVPDLTNSWINEWTIHLLINTWPIVGPMSVWVSVIMIEWVNNHSWVPNSNSILGIVGPKLHILTPCYLSPHIFIRAACHRWEVSAYRPQSGVELGCKVQGK